MNTSFKLFGMILVSLFSFMGIYFLKVSLTQLIPEGSPPVTLLKIMPQILLQGKFWLALLGYGSALMVYLFLLSADEASKIFTLTVGVNILLTTLAAAFFLGDTLDIARIIGICLIITGIILIYEY